MLPWFWRLVIWQQIQMEDTGVLFESVKITWSYIFNSFFSTFRKRSPTYCISFIKISESQECLMWNGRFENVHFWFPFPRWLSMWTRSSSVSQKFEFSLLRTLHLELYPIFNFIICFICPVSWLIYFGEISPSSVVRLVKIFFLFCRLLFCPFDAVLGFKEAFRFYEVPFINCWA